MKYSYSIARSKFNKSEKIFIDSVVQSWRSYNKHQGVLIKNFKKEHYLDSKLYVDLFKYLITKNNLNSKNVYDYIYSYFRDYILSGGSPKLPNISKLGFALTEWSVRKNLENNYLDIFNYDLKEIQLFIDNLKKNRVDNFFDFITIKKLRETLWMTFDSITDNPFCFLQTNDRKEVYVSLGLSTYYRDYPIILFIINLEKEFMPILNKATVFDAGDYKYFKPPIFTQKDYGFTNPHNSGKIKKGGKEYIYTKRPEIVCDSREIKFRHIITTISL